MYQNIFVSKKDNTIYLWDDKQGLVTYKNKPYAYKKSPNGMYRSMYGDKLEKVTKYRYEDEGLFESDVPIETRNLIDLYEDDDEPSTGHCVLNFDIEVSMEGELLLQKEQTILLLLLRITIVVLIIMWFLF